MANPQFIQVNASLYAPLSVSINLSNTKQTPASPSAPAPNTHPHDQIQTPTTHLITKHRPHQTPHNPKQPPAPDSHHHQTPNNTRNQHPIYYLFTMSHHILRVSDCCFKSPNVASMNWMVLSCIEFWMKITWFEKPKNHNLTKNHDRNTEALATAGCNESEKPECAPRCGSTQRGERRNAVPHNNWDHHRSRWRAKPWDVSRIKHLL